MNMNSKKNKKNVNNSELAEDASNNAIPKKTKKKKAEVTNENANLENKSKKRKLVTPEPEVVPPKKAKKKLKSITSLENNTEIPPTDDIENNVPSAKNSKRKNINDKTIIPEEVNYNTNEEPDVHKKTEQTTKKGKKKKKKEDIELESTKNDSTELDNEDPGEGVSSTKNIKHSKNSNQLVSSDGPKETIYNNPKKLIHEVNIVDIKDEKGNEGNENVVTISIKDVEGMDSDWDENALLKQLERKVDKVPKEKKVAIQWPDSDLLELVERMEVGLPENDLKPYAKRTDELEWDKIAFKNYSIEDCRKTWSLVVKRIRRYRILKEVIHDAKQWITAPKSIKKQPKVQRHPDMPRRPLSAYFIYYLKKKDAMQAEHPGMDAAELAKLCSQKFKLLPPEKMVKYENIAKKNREEYDQKMKEFYEIHPELKVEKERSKKASRTPKPPKPPKPVKEKPPPKPPKPPKDKVPKRPLPAFQYYHIAELAKQAVEDKVAFKELCRERWKEMPDDKKIEWITYAENENVKYEEEMKEYIKNHPDFENNVQKPQLTKEELLVKDRVSGKPAKPPVSAYNLFARIMLHSDDIKNVPVKERLVFVSNQWKECNEEQKKYYKELFDKTMVKYHQDLAAYLQSLPEEERKLELLKIQPKRRKSEDEKTKKESKPKKPSKKKAEPKPEKKKIVPKPVEKKVDKVDGKKPRKLVEPEQPPISPFKYFATLYKGEEPVAKAWKALSTEEKDKYEEELVKKKKAYILDFEKFLKSMTKEELENFSNSRKKQNNQKEEEDDEDDDDEDETSDQSDSEDNSDDSGEEEK